MYLRLIILIPLLTRNGEKCKENSKDVSSTVAEQSKDNEMDDKHEGETAKDEGPKQEKDEEDMKEEKKVGEDLEIGNFFKIFFLSFLY